MAVLFCHDHRFTIGSDGAVYSRGQYSDVIVARYERVFGKLVIAARATPAPVPFDAARFNVVFADTSRFRTIGDLSSGKKLILGDAGAQRQIAEAIDGVDAVVVRLPSEIGLLAGAVARRMGKPVITEVVACVHDGLMSHGGLKARAYAPVALRRMRLAVAKSDWTLYVTERFLQHRYPSAGEQVSVSNVQLPPRDEAVLDRRLERVSAGPLVVGMVAAMFHNEKRVDVAIRGLARAARAGLDLRLQIAGPGATEGLRALAEELHVSDRVEFCGVIPHGKQLFAFLDGLDVYVQTSFQEGLPRALIEAMSRGLPALASDVGGTNELLAAEWLHTAGDDRTLATQLTRMADGELRSRLATENFVRAADFDAAALDRRRAAFWTRFCLANGIRPATGERVDQRHHRPEAAAR
jgi:glycosyltransferase involved in cell wall biosynthesis